MSSAGAHAGLLSPTAAPCRWPCRPSAWANRLFIWLWFSSSCALRRSSNGYHWVLSIIWFSLVHGPHRRPPARGQRSPGACSGCTCRVKRLYSERCSLSRIVFTLCAIAHPPKVPCQLVPRWSDVADAAWHGCAAEPWGRVGYSSRRTSALASSRARMARGRARQAARFSSRVSSRSARKCFSSSATTPRVAEGDVELVVERERAVVEVDRPDGDPVGVHEQDLGVEHGAPVLEDPPAAAQQVLVTAPPGLADDLPVGVGAVAEHAHVHAAADRVAERVDERAPWREVGGGQPDPLAGAGDRGVEQLLGVGAALLRGGAGDLGLRCAHASRSRSSSPPVSSAAAAHAASTPRPAHGPMGRLLGLVVAWMVSSAVIGPSCWRCRCQ